MTRVQDCGICISMKEGITKTRVNLSLDQFRNVISCVGVLSSVAYDDKMNKGRGQLRFSELDIVNDIVIQLFTETPALFDKPFKEYSEEQLDKLMGFFVSEWNRRVAHVWLLQDQHRIKSKNEKK